MASKNNSNYGSSQMPNCSLSWTQNRRSEQRIKPSATLDLHGYNKEAAIRELTLFLERNSKITRPWVCVITGTGSHSGSLGGPVLKTAVHRLLEKRHMEYCYARKKGSFFVNAQSGIELRANPTVEEQQMAAAGGDTSAFVLQDPLFQDTKVRLVQQPQPIFQLPKNHTAGMGKKMRKALPHQFAANHNNYSQDTSDGSNTPSLTQLKEEEQLLRQAKTHSLQETSKWKSQRDKEQHELQQVLRQTEMEALEDEQREKEELRQAMALSQQAQVKETCVETHHEQELERVLQLSLQEKNQQQQAALKEDDDEEEILQKVISESNLEHMQQQQQEEEALERALRMSMVDSAATKEESSAPKKEEEEEEEDEELQRVLRLSMMETSASNNFHGNSSWQEELQANSDSEEKQQQETLEDQNSKAQAGPALDCETVVDEIGYEQSSEGPLHAAETGHHQDDSATHEWNERGVSRTTGQTARLAPSSNAFQSQQLHHTTQQVSSSSSHVSPALVENLPTGEALLESILYKNPTSTIQANSHYYEPASSTGAATTHQEQQQELQEQSSNNELESATSSTGNTESFTTDEQLTQVLQRPIGSPIGSAATTRY